MTRRLLRPLPSLALLPLVALACGEPERRSRVDLDLGEVVERYRALATENGRVQSALVAGSGAAFRLEIGGPALTPSACFITLGAASADVSCEDEGFGAEATGPASFSIDIPNGPERELFLFGAVTDLAADSGGNAAFYARVVADVPGSIEGDRLVLSTSLLDSGTITVALRDPAGQGLEAIPGDGSLEIAATLSPFSTGEPIAPRLRLATRRVEAGVFLVSGVPVTPLADERAQLLPDDITGRQRTARFEVAARFIGGPLVEGSTALERVGPTEPTGGVGLTLVPPAGFTGTWFGTAPGDVDVTVELSGVGGGAPAGFVTTSDGDLDRAPLEALSPADGGRSIEAAVGGRTISGSFSDDWQQLEVTLQPFAAPFTLGLEIGDNRPPRVRITSPQDGTIIGREAIGPEGLFVEGTVDDPEATVLVNQIRVALGEAPTPGALLPWSVSVPLTPGENTLRATASDTVGNVGADQVTVTFDTSGPGGNVQVLEGALVNSRDVTVRVIGSEETVSITVGEVDALGACPAGDRAAYAPEDGRMDIPFQLSDSEGPHIVSVAFFDVASNRSCLTAAVELDRVPPELTLDAPLPGRLECAADLDAVLPGLQVESSITAVGALDGNEVQFTVTGSDAGPARADLSGGEASATVTLPSRGVWEVVATVEDAAGNLGEVRVNVENGCNTAPILGDLDDVDSVLDLLKTIVGSATDPDGDAVTLSWRLAEAPAGSGATLEEQPQQGPADSPTRNVRIAADVVGDYRLELTADDGAGGVTTGEVVMRTPPFIIGLNPPRGVVGDLVVLTVRNYNRADAGDNRYAFSSAAGFVAAEVTANPAPGPGDALVTVRVPAGAVDGPVQVTNQGGTGQSSEDFDILD